MKKIWMIVTDSDKYNYEKHEIETDKTVVIATKKELKELIFKMLINGATIKHLGECFKYSYSKDASKDIPDTL